MPIFLKASLTSGVLTGTTRSAAMTMRTTESERDQTWWTRWRLGTGRFKVLELEEEDRQSSSGASFGRVGKENRCSRHFLWFSSVLQPKGNSRKFGSLLSAWTMKLLPVLVLVSLLVVTAANEDDDQATARLAEEVPEPTIQIKEGDGVHQFAVAIPALQQTHYQAVHDNGRYSFGYAYPDQVHVESRSDDGTVTGSYYYTDANGKQNQVAYKADETGFHVTANNLPVFAPGPLPEPVQDTPEVAEAKRQHMAIWNAIAEQHAKSDAAVTVASGQSADKKPADAPTQPEFDPLQVQTKPIDVDVTVDDEKEAIITDRLTDQSGFEVDAEPIKILAQLYAKHLNHTVRERPEAIERPEGFYPSELRSPSSAPDIFRSVDDSDAAVVVTNPEFVDLRAFVLTNRFRSVDAPVETIESRSRPVDVEADEPAEAEISESAVEVNVEPAPEMPLADVAAAEPAAQPAEIEEKPADDAVNVQVVQVKPAEEPAKVESGSAEPTAMSDVNVEAAQAKPVDDVAQVEQETPVEPESPSVDAIVIQASDPIEPIPVPQTNAADSVRIPIESLDEPLHSEQPQQPEQLDQPEQPDPTRFDDGTVATQFDDDDESVTVQLDQPADSGDQPESFDTSAILKQLFKYLNQAQPGYYDDYYNYPYANRYYHYPSVSPYYVMFRNRPSYRYYSSLSPYYSPYYSPYQNYQQYAPYYYYYGY